MFKHLTENHKTSISIAKMKYPKINFAGDDAEKAYIYGFWLGDYTSRIDGQQIRISASSTRGEFTYLFRKLFGKYGRIKIFKDRSPRILPNGKMGEPEWKMYALLNHSFDFILPPKRSNIPEWIKPQIFAFLAGIIDADGHISLYPSKNKYWGIEIGISNSNTKLLREVKKIIPIKSRYKHYKIADKIVWDTHKEAHDICLAILPYLKLPRKKIMAKKVIRLFKKAS